MMIPPLKKKQTLFDHYGALGYWIISLFYMSFHVWEFYIFGFIQWRIENTWGGEWGEF